MNMEIQRAKRPRPDQRLCPHCDQVLAYKTFRAHKRLHYSSEANVWFKVERYHVQTSERRDPCMLEDNSPDMPSGHELECTLNQAADETRAESPPLSEPAYSPISNDHQYDFDNFQFDSDDNQSSG